MTRRRKFFEPLALLACILALIFLSAGCETCKGAARDVQKADQWIRDHAW